MEDSHSLFNSPEMLLEKSTFTDDDILHSIKHALSLYSPSSIKITYDASVIDFPLKTHTLILDYNIHTTSQAIELRRILAQTHANTIILNGHTNLLQYIRENTFEYGSGLFGAVLRNTHIQHLIIHNYTCESYDGRNIKHYLKQEQRNYMRNLLTPMRKVKIHIKESA